MVMANFSDYERGSIVADQVIIEAEFSWHG